MTDADRIHADAGIAVIDVASSAFAPVFELDPSPPKVLYVKGDLAAIAGPRVAIVGTRDCTHQGHDFAFELAHDLSTAGVRVVSGLALGIDGAAHAGALESGAAPPIAVVGSGLDVVYPKRHGSLWRAVASRGLLLSEHPLGTAPTAWHFPARNRIIAALADVVVVVESHESGGSLNTAREALVRDREILAVPGPVQSRASAGTNLLLRDGAGVCLGVDDVLTVLGLSSEAINRSDETATPAPAPPACDVRDALGGQPGSVEQLVLRTGLTTSQVALRLTELEAEGWVVCRGGWYEPSTPRPNRTGKPADAPQTTLRGR